MDAFILNALKRIAKQTRIDFKNPDRIIVVETVKNRSGVGLITREMKEKYPLIKVK
jgi:tRNA(Ser,Leu) C12 N-acetylase TAN1